MGFFSWKTQDTRESIFNVFAEEDWGARRFPVVMTDNAGKQWIEEQYEGYGVFGGKDFFELLAEMNGETGRQAGIDLAHGDEPFLSPNLTRSARWKWMNATPQNCECQGYFEPFPNARTGMGGEA
jgi:hypothetical protein